MPSNLEPSALPLTGLILTDQLDDQTCRAIYSIYWVSELVIVTRNPDFPIKTAKKILDEYQQKHSLPPLQLTKVNISVFKDQPQDFGLLRNLGLSQVETEWALFLDSDEVFPTYTTDEVTKLLAAKNISGYQLQRKDWFLGKKLEWGEVRDVWVTRLMKKSQAKWLRPVHEVVEINGEVLRVPGIIQHYSHSSISEFLNKITTYAQLESNLRLANKQETSAFELVVWPVGKFLVNFYFKLGFLDGWRGLVYAVMMSLHSLAVRAMLYEKTY